MMVRMFHWDARQVYEFYNLNHKDWPNLPPPPNPKGLQMFMMACLEVTVDQLNRENGGDEKPEKRLRQQRYHPQRSR